MVPYRANVWALKELGVQRIVGRPVGSLQPHFKPGEFVVSDQLVDRTTGRPSTFYDGPVDPHLVRRPLLPHHARGDRREGPRARPRPARQGDRRRSRAEVLDPGRVPPVRAAGLGDHQHDPEPRGRPRPGAEICYGNISLVTDYDVGVAGEVPEVSNDEVVRVFQENLSRLRELLFRVLEALPEERDCPCATALEHARFVV